jgi:ABC-type branched-subunit amino acid transport system substrate-binding protein
VNEARRLALREGVHAVAGPYLSQLVLATAPVFTQSKILSTSTASSSAVTVDIAPYHFSVAPDVYGQAEVMIGYASDTLKVGKVSILHDNGALGKAGRQALEETSKAKGLEVSGVQEFQYRASDVTPQLLALRRSESEALVIWPTVGEDAGLIQKNLAELGWDIPVIGATSVSGQAPAAVKIAGPDAFKNTVAADYGGFTYCKGDPVGVSPFAKLMETVKADGHDLDKVATQTISLGYDMVMVLAVAIENTESVDGSVLAKWIEANSEKLPYTAVTAYTASPGQHFMTGPKGMGIVVNSDKPREDLLRERITNCEG